MTSQNMCLKPIQSLDCCGSARVYWHQMEGGVWLSECNNCPTLLTRKYRTVSQWILDWFSAFTQKPSNNSVCGKYTQYNILYVQHYFFSSDLVQCYWTCITLHLVSRHKAIYKYNFCNIVLDPKYIITLKGRICHVLIFIFLFGVHGVSWRECIRGPITYFVTVHVARCSTGIDYDYILQSHYLSSSFSSSTSALFSSSKSFLSSTWS